MKYGIVEVVSFQSGARSKSLSLFFNWIFECHMHLIFFKSGNMEITLWSMIIKFQEIWGWMLIVDLPPWNLENGLTVNRPLPKDPQEMSLMPNMVKIEYPCVDRSQFLCQILCNMLPNSRILQFSDALSPYTLFIIILEEIWYRYLIFHHQIKDLFPRSTPAYKLVINSPTDTWKSGSNFHVSNAIINSNQHILWTSWTLSSTQLIECQNQEKKMLN